MNWGKTVLVFQAIVTLFVGMAFFMQVIKLDANKIADFNIEKYQEVKGETDLVAEQKAIDFISLKNRYYVAAYVLLIIGLMELMIISRLMS